MANWVSSDADCGVSSGKSPIRFEKIPDEGGWASRYGEKGVPVSAWKSMKCGV
jgi:hypothetical protein